MVRASNAPPPQSPTGARPIRASGGRPTKAAAAERDERLLAIATRMFLEHGFDATSMDRLAEAATIGKATLYARYADKAALFEAVLRRRILQTAIPIEADLEESADAGADLPETLRMVAHRMLDHTISPDTVAMRRILIAQSTRFPELARMAIQEGVARQIDLIARIFTRFAGRHAYRTEDVGEAAELFLGIAVGRGAKMELFGIAVDADRLHRRLDVAVDIFLHGILVGPRDRSDPTP